MRDVTQRSIFGLVAVAGLLAAPACRADPAVPFGNTSAAHGVAVIESAGCGACHTIPGIADANGLVGPPLDHMRRRIFIAGLLRNTPDNLVMWLQNPQKVVPGNAMPNMGLSKQQAEAVADYLYTLE